MELENGTDTPSHNAEKTGPQMIEDSVSSPQHDAIDAALEQSSDSGLDSSTSSSDSDPDDSDASDAEDEDATNVSEDKEAPFTKNEVIDVKIPKLPEDFSITESTKIEKAGMIFNVAANSVIIQASSSGEYHILDEGAIFCLQDKTIVGPLYETFGPIDRPFYVVKFEPGTDLSQFSRDQDAYYVVTSSKFVLTEEFKVKGSDASNLHDEEVALEDQDYSDDEEEAAARGTKRRKRAKKANPKPRPSSAVAQRPVRVPDTHMSSMQNMQNMQLQMQNQVQNQINMQNQMSQWYQYQQQIAMVQPGLGNLQNQPQHQPFGYPQMHQMPSMTPAPLMHTPQYGMQMQPMFLAPAQQQFYSPMAPQQLSSPVPQSRSNTTANDRIEDEQDDNVQHQWPTAPPY